MKKLLSVISLIILSSVLAGLSVQAVVLDDYEASEAYKSGIFYKTLSEYELTGDQRYDVVSIALTQLGYEEGDSDKDMHGTSGGGRNFVEFNRLYGKLDNDEGNGHSYGYMWCASFVNWVLRAANVDQRVSGGEVSCASWVYWLQGKNMFKERTSGYTPVCGDIIFFKGSRTSSISNHVGIVIGSENGIVHTIEGNTTGLEGGADSTNGGQIARKSYHLNDTYIVGYGIPRYTVKDGTVYDFELINFAPRKAGDYTVLGRSTGLYRTASMSTKLKSIPSGKTVTVTQVSGSFGKCEYDGVEGWVSLDGMISANGAYHTISYNTYGAGEIASQEKIYGKDIKISSTVPEKPGHEFKGWAIKEGGNIIYQPSDTYIMDLDVELCAVWQATEEYTIIFKLDDGTVLSEKKYHYGDTVEVPELTLSDENTSKTLTWDSEITTVDGDKTYTAVYIDGEATENNGQSSQDDSSSTVSTGTLIIILSVVIVLAAAAIIFALCYKKKTPDQK